jgi:hypothetical protein
VKKIYLTIYPNYLKDGYLVEPFETPENQV